MTTQIASLAAAGILAGAAISHAQAAGFATYFATVRAVGTVATSSGVASATKTAVGRYEITFNRKINGCATLVTVNGAVPGYGVTRRKPNTTDALQVSLYSKAGKLTNFPFHILVSCNS